MFCPLINDKCRNDCALLINSGALEVCTFSAIGAKGVDSFSVVSCFDNGREVTKNYGEGRIFTVEEDKE